MGKAGATGIFYGVHNLLCIYDERHKADSIRLNQMGGLACGRGYERIRHGHNNKKGATHAQDELFNR